MKCLLTFCGTLLLLNGLSGCVVEKAPPAPDYYAAPPSDYYYATPGYYRRTASAGYRY